ncbi:MAG: hypothetical protein ACLTCP_10875 [Ruminococcus bicirculans (ex Wegman et al. 2014)]
MAVREAISAYGGAWRTILQDVFFQILSGNLQENQKNKYISDNREHMRRVTIDWIDKDEHIIKFALSEDDIKIFFRYGD